MIRRFTRARMPIPPFHRAADKAVTAEALRARSFARQSGPQYELYAGCDRAPLGWELGQ